MGCKCICLADKAQHVVMLIAHKYVLITDSYTVLHVAVKYSFSPGHVPFYSGGSVDNNLPCPWVMHMCIIILFTCACAASAALVDTPTWVQGLCMGCRPAGAAVMPTAAVPVGALQQQHDAARSDRPAVAHGQQHACGIQTGTGLDK